jgi:N-acetylglucosaminyl-diphospho-decaprenol L-rhamnosyltransferase
MHDPSPTTAAIVLNFRTPKRTLSCLRSLMEQGVRRIVLVDNSEDEEASLRAMQPALDALRCADVDLDVLSTGRNLGFAAGVNLALAHIKSTRASDVMLLNSDARLLPGCLSAMHDSLRAGAAATAPLLVANDGSIHQPISYYQRHTGILSNRPVPGAIAYITGACILLSLEVAQPKLLDEDFFFYGEDIVLAMQLHRYNMRCTVTENGLALHEGGGSARNGSPFYEYHINRSHCLLAAKLAGNSAEFAFNVAGRLMFLPIRAMIRSIRNRNVTPLISLFSAVCDVANGRTRTMTPPATQQK